MLRFEWDPVKERRNRSKHGLDFSFAALVWADPLRAFVYDRFQDGEDRWHALGAVAAGFKVLLVVHTYPDPDDPDRVRILGLRQATTQERRRYEEGD